MGLSILSILQIQENETYIETYGSTDSGKWGYAITHNEEKRFRPIVTCDPTYSSQKEALTEGEKLREEVLAFDMDKHRQEIVGTIGQKDSKLVQDIIEESKEL